MSLKICLQFIMPHIFPDDLLELSASAKSIYNIIVNYLKISTNIKDKNIILTSDVIGENFSFHHFL